jgi:hypothetical protein
MKPKSGGVSLLFVTVHNRTVRSLPLSGGARGVEQYECVPFFSNVIKELRGALQCYFVFVTFCDKK